MSFAAKLLLSTMLLPATAGADGMEQGSRVSGPTSLQPLPAFSKPVSGLGITPPFRISPDSQYVVYATPGRQLFSLRVRDGFRTFLAPLPECWSFLDFRISSDSSRVLFTCSITSGTRRDLFAIPLEGPPSSAVQISLPANYPDQVWEYAEWLVEGHVLYTFQTLEDHRIDLFGVPLQGPGSAGVLLSLPTESSHVSWITALPQSSRVVFMGSNGSLIREIWLTDLKSPDPVRIATSPPDHPFTYGFLVSPDEQRIVWSAQDEVEDAWIYSAPISNPPGAAVRLSVDLPPFRSAYLAAISPTSDRVAYLADPELWNSHDLFSVPVEGPATQSINLSEFDLPRFVHVSYLQFSHDGDSIYYLADREQANRHDLYSVPTVGPASATIRINPVSRWTDSAGIPSQMPGTHDVVFPLSDLEHDQSYRCFRGSLVGAEANAIPLWVQPFSGPSGALGCTWIEESRGVLAESVEAEGVRALWLAHGDGPLDGLPKRLMDSRPFAQHEDPFNRGLEPTPDGRFVIYAGTLAGSEHPGVWALPLPFYWDGFESGGTGHWTSVQPPAKARPAQD